MGRRGPPKKPTELKLLQGIPGGKHKLPRAEPKPSKTRNARPSIPLSKGSKKIWTQITGRLEALGLLTEIDINMLSRYCDIFDKWLQAKAYLDANGFKYPVYERLSDKDLRAGKKPRITYLAQFPEVSVYKELGKDLARLEAQFGMSPASRAGLGVDTDGEGKAGSIQSWLYGK